MGSGGMTIAGDSFKEGMDAEERECKPGYVNEVFTPRILCSFSDCKIPQYSAWGRTVERF